MSRISLLRRGHRTVACLATLAIGLPLSAPAAAAGPDAGLAPEPGTAVILAACLSTSLHGTGMVDCEGSSRAVEIWQVGADGSEPRRLTYLGGVASSPDLAPDGSRVAFDAAVPGGDARQIFVIAREGRRAQTVIAGTAVIKLHGARPAQLTTEGANYDPVWSADGRRVAFLTDRGGAAALWVMDADGSDQHPLLAASATR